MKKICFTPGWPRAKGTGHFVSRGASGVPAQLSCQTSPMRITAAVMYIWLLKERGESIGLPSQVFALVHP